MLVTVAVRATLKLDLEQRVLALGDVALRASQTGVTALQRISAGGVLLHCKERGPPSLHVVAGCAFALVRALGELAIVGIGFVAIHTLLEGDRLLEISIGVALRAIHGRMVPFQRKLRFRVVEPLIDQRQRYRLPARGAMAGLAALREAAAMRILVAVRALIKGNAYILRLAIGAIRMTSSALYRGVQAGERVPGFGVVELSDGDALPVFNVVTLLALRSQPSFVLIGVTGDTSGRQAQISAGRIRDFYCCSLLRRNVRWVVTAVAGNIGVLALQRVPCLLVVERFDVPLDEWKCFAIVLRVAAGTFLAGTARNVKRLVQSLLSAYPRIDLRVALQALEGRFPAKLMASGALARSIERLVRPR